MVAGEERLRAIIAAVQRGGFLMTVHADEEAREEGISVKEIREALIKGEILEDYPAHRRGPCCLVYGRLGSGRDLHVVVTTDKIPPRIITVYEPRSPFWVTPRERGAER